VGFRVPRRRRGASNRGALHLGYFRLLNELSVQSDRRTSPSRARARARSRCAAAGDVIEYATRED
jgi:hypothetical protein